MGLQMVRRVDRVPQTDEAPKTVAPPWLEAHECSVNQSPEAVSYLTWQLPIIAKGETACAYTEKTLSLWGAP